MLDSPVVSPVSWQEHGGHEQLWCCVPKPGHYRSGGISAHGLGFWKSWSILEVMQLEGKQQRSF